MATWADLSGKDKGIVRDFDGLQRAWLGELHILILKAGIMQSQYTELVGPILTTLDAGEIVPSNDGLAGNSGEETHEVITTWKTSFIDGLITDYGADTQKDDYVRAAGPRAAGITVSN